MAIDLISQNEADELCENLIRKFIGNAKELPPCVDIEGFLVNFLGYSLVYECIAEPNTIGFTSDGVYPLKIYQNGKVVEVVYPKNTVVIDRYLLRIDESSKRRFTIGHEIGHILDEQITPQPSFHREFCSGKQYNFKELSALLSMKESHADKLSAGLLMPRFMVDHTLEQYNAGRRLPVYGNYVFSPREKVILKKMEDSLGVSFTALFIRMKRFKMFSYHELSEFIEKELKLGGNLN